MLELRLNGCLRSVGSQRAFFVHYYDDVLIPHFDRQNRCRSTMNERHATWRKDIIYQQLSLSLSQFLTPKSHFLLKNFLFTKYFPETHFSIKRIKVGYLVLAVLVICTTASAVLTLRLLMSYIYMEHLFLMFLDHTQRRSTVGRTPLDE